MEISKIRRRGSEWVTLLRALVILRRLQETPADAERLMKAVEEALGEGAYPRAESARRAAFKHDRENLRNRLGAEIRYDPATREYSLSDPGPFGSLSLSQESLHGLSILSRQFSSGIGEKADILTLIKEIVSRLTPEQRRKLENIPDAITLDIRQDVDKGVIPVRVWECIHSAVEKHRKLSFNHLSPRSQGGLAVYYEVAPQRILYQEGHWYLRAWSLLRRDAKGRETRQEAYLRFRLNYIQDDEYLRVWPTVLPVQYRRPPRYFVHYQLMPEIARGEISHHFDDIQIDFRPDGSAEVKGFTDDLWGAARILLAYGESCIVLGGQALLKEMHRRVEGLARNYGLLEE